MVVRKLIGSLICYHLYYNIYYSAVASNLLRLAISRAISLRGLKSCKNATNALLLINY